MALLIRGKTECALCRQVIDHADEVVGTTHFIADQADPLWQYSDAAFYKRCFDAWENRDEFLVRCEEVRRKRGYST
jgi:hypothetical protein